MLQAGRTKRMTEKIAAGRERGGAKKTVQALRNEKRGFFAPGRISLKDEGVQVVW